MLSTARSHLGLLVVLGLGVVFRLALSYAISPAHLNYIDSWGYATEASGPLFIPHFYRPAGYSAFLAATTAVWPSLQATIVLQHLLGLLTAVAFYAALLGLGQPRWVALVPTAVVALTGDVLYFEHTLLSEWLFMGLLAAALLCASRFVTREAGVGRALAWGAAAGLALGLASTVRGAGMFAIPVFALAVLLRPAAGLVARLLPAAGVALVAGAVVLAYMGLQYRETDYFGYTDGRGWATYARAAPFADCTAFTPPKGTEALCEKSDARLRAGPDHYMWDADSPAIRIAPAGPPTNDELFGRFGRAALIGQPRAYSRAIARDMWRFVHADGRAGFGQPPLSLDLAARNVNWEQFNRHAVDPLFGAREIRFRPAATKIGAVQEVLRVHGPLVLLATLLTLLAVPFARGQRVVLLLLGGTALLSLLLSVATQGYNWRFAVPVLPFLVASGAVGLRVLALRFAPGRSLAFANRPRVGRRAPA